MEFNGTSNRVEPGSDHWSGHASGPAMIDPLLNAIFTVVDFVFDLSIAIDRTKRLSHQTTGSDTIVEVPAAPKPLPPAAQRALAEAEERERAAQAASSGTDEAS
ncbi:hypothetical protein ACVMAJ_005451 [Bradyrhizobium sp. USDA 4448]